MTNKNDVPHNRAHAETPSPRSSDQLRAVR